MITHVVVLRLAATDPSTRAEHATEYKRRIDALAGAIPGLLSLTVGIDIGRIDWHWDVSLVSTHASYDDLEAYQAHPLHRDVLAYGDTIVADRAVVDHET